MVGYRTHSRHINVNFVMVGAVQDLEAIDEDLGVMSDEDLGHNDEGEPTVKSNIILVDPL